MAGSLNKVQLIGNLGSDPEIRRTQGGNPVASFSIATSETWRDRNSGERKEKTEWHNVVIWNEGLCKVAEQYLKKGSKVFVEGKMQTRKWQDKDGNDRHSTEVVLQFNALLVMLSGKDENGGGSNNRRDGRRDDRDDRRSDDRSRGRDDNRSSGGYGNGGSFARDMDDDIPFAPEWR
ncbi:single-stranded DNA-binding protein [Pararhizobium sp. BT-229]|uniref:single-stranded DNA-binding protein n=1 Tax=Pararhizobium sp. BT-229 TaxID=2986923 RepID=UPI0021F711B2|nr:single-stranded DNA-binding protein [Pararhizobium sp. BT-229]MCV9960788.1 single-stranded DNA-binding protein [Pararhizobium sp. BT-229]